MSCVSISGQQMSFGFCKTEWTHQQILCRLPYVAVFPIVLFCVVETELQVVLDSLEGWIGIVLQFFLDILQCNGLQNVHIVVWILSPRRLANEIQGNVATSETC